MNKKLEELFKTALGDYDFNTALSLHAVFDFAEWQWAYIIRVALRVDQPTLPSDEEIKKVYNALNNKYGIESDTPKSKKEMDGLLREDKKTRKLLNIVETNLHTSPSSLILHFAYNENNVNHTRISSFLNLLDIPYNPPCCLEPLYIQLENSDTKKREPHISFLKKVLGECTYNYIIKKHGYRILSPKGINLMLALADVSPAPRNVLEPILHSNEGEIAPASTKKQRRLDSNSLYRARQKFIIPEVQDALIACLEGRNKDIHQLTEISQKQAFKRNHPKMFEFCYKLTGHEIYYMLTFEEFEVMLNNAQAKNDKDRTPDELRTDRLIMHEYYGTTDGIEKTESNIKVKNEKCEYISAKEITTRVIVMQEMLANPNNKAKEILAAIITGNKKFIEDIKLRAKYRNQLFFLNKYAKTQISGNQIYEPLKLELWDELLDALLFSEFDKEVFKLYNGVYGKGELSLKNISNALYASIEDVETSYNTSHANCRNHSSDLEKVLTDYYNNGIWDTCHVGRTKQKKFLRSIVKEMANEGETAEEVDVVLTQEQFTALAAEAGLTEKQARCISFNWGIGVKREYDYEEIGTTFNPPLNRNQVHKIIKTGNKKIKEKASSMVLEFIKENSNSMEERKTLSPHSVLKSCKTSRKSASNPPPPKYAYSRIALTQEPPLAQ